jgi:hypothetical protein
MSGRVVEAPDDLKTIFDQRETSIELLETKMATVRASKMNLFIVTDPS